MDIFLKYEIFMDECNKVAFNDELFNKHPEVFENLFSDEPLDIRVYQRIANKKFLDRNDNYSNAVKWLVNDIKDKKSILSKMFKGKYSEGGLSALERNICIFKELFPLLVLRQYAYRTLPGERYYLLYYRKYGFKFYLPEEFLKSKFGEEYKSIDLSTLTSDEFIEYILPDYYLSLSFNNIRMPKAHKEDALSNLGREWFNEENQVVSAVE